jgi:hypothetical protein
VNYFQLPIVPYNHIWLNCFSNALISILNSVNMEFSYLPCHYQSTYAYCCMMDTGKISESLIKDHETLGWYVLKVAHKRPDLKPWLSLKEEKVSVQDMNIQYLKEKIAEGNYVFLGMDRFYYPGGVEYQTSHLIHQSLFVGFDEDKQCFILLEDCVRLGYMELFELPYANFTEAMLEVYKDKVELSFRCFRIHSDAADNPFKVRKEIVSASLKRHLALHRFEMEATYEYHGINAVLHYADNIENVIPKVTDLVNLIKSSSEPMTLQKIRLLTVEILEKNGQLTQKQAEILNKMYTDLLIEWELFKNKIAVNSKRNQTKFKINYQFYVDLRAKLFKNYVDEKKVTELFLQMLDDVNVTEWVEDQEDPLDFLRRFVW